MVLPLLLSTGWGFRFEGATVPSRRVGEPPARSASAEKKKLRQRLRLVTGSLPPTERAAAETLIHKHLLDWFDGSSAAASPGVVLGTLPMQGEPDLTGLLADLLGRGRRVALAAVDPGRERALRILEVAHPDDLRSTRPGPLGTREPARSREIGPEQLSFMLVPGVAFSVTGQRLGRGRGYFDEMIRSAGGRAVTVGVAFECQVLDALPVEPHDATVDWLCTERGLRPTP